jgi:hypothetical protein
MTKAGIKLSPDPLLTYLVVAALLLSVGPAAYAERWSAEKAHAWYEQIQWPVGANFVPSTAINQLEMWQKETWDPETIDRELGWAADIGMNSMRVYLHNIPFDTDPDGFLQRIDQYLAIADKHRMRTLFVFFDAVWHSTPKAGKQPEPRPRLHNSGWVQSPGVAILGEPSRLDELKPHVQAVLRRFQNDKRVLAWDLFNEPDMGKSRSDSPQIDMRLKRQGAFQLLEKTFAWAREINPSQPLTVGVWHHKTWMNKPEGFERISLEQSDIISFHSYHDANRTRALIEGLQKSQRPIFCTEYMARTRGSTFEAILPLLKKHRVAAYNWGLVDGKTQTKFPWDSWSKKFPAEPDPWFHDLFRSDGSPYRQDEVDLIRRLTADS